MKTEYETPTVNYLVLYQYRDEEKKKHNSWMNIHEEDNDNVIAEVFYDSCPEDNAFISLVLKLSNGKWEQVQYLKEAVK